MSKKLSTMGRKNSLLGRNLWKNQVQGRAAICREWVSLPEWVPKRQCVYKQTVIQ